MKNEVTSRQVAKIASRLLKVKEKRNEEVYIRIQGKSGLSLFRQICTIKEIRAIAASCLTQRSDQ